MSKQRKHPRKKASQDTRKSTPLWTKARFALPIVYLILFALSLFFPGKLWVFSSIVVLPIWFKVIVGLVLLAMLSNKVLTFIEIGYSWLGKTLFGKSNTVGLIVFAVISLVFLIIANNDHVFIGDSHTVETMIKKADYEDTSLHRMPTILVYKFCSKLLSSIDTWKAINYLHILLGLLFSIIIYQIMQQIFDRPEDKGAFTMMFFASYPILVFTHIELYALAFLFVALYWLIFVKWLKNPSQKPVLVFGGNILTIIFHHLSAYLVPITLNGILVKQGRKKLLLPNLIVFLVLMFIGAAFATIRENFIIFTNFAYLFKPGYISLTISYLFAASPFILFALFAGKSSIRDLEGSDEHARFNENLIAIFSIASLWAILLLHFMDFKFGANDWDVAIMVAFPVFLLCAYILGKSSRRAIKAMAVGLSLLFIIMHLWLGTSYDLQAERQRHLVLGQTTPYFEQNFPPLMKLGVIYGYESDLERSKQAFEEYIAENPYEIKGYNAVATILSREEKYDEAMEVIRRAMEFKPGDRGLMTKYEFTRIVGQLTRDGIIEIDRERTSDRMNQYRVSISENLIEYLRGPFLKKDYHMIAFILDHYQESHPEGIQEIREKCLMFQGEVTNGDSSSVPEFEFPDSAAFYGRLVSILDSE